MKNRSMIAVITASTLALALGTAATAAAGATRVAGVDRFDTSLKIAEKYFPNAKTVYVATGINFPDALAAGPAAAQAGGPVLLVGNNVPAGMKDYLKKISPKQINVVGGASSVSDAVVEEIKGAVTADSQVSRINGVDRFATAAAATAGWASPVDTVFLASGTSFPDALSGGALAASLKAPLLLTYAERLTDSTRDALSRLKPRKVIAIGGASAVNDNVLNSAASAAGAKEQERIAGKDRFDTANQVAKRFTNKTDALVANGMNFPDALAGVPIAGALSIPLLLTKTDCSPTPSKVNAVILGGPSAVTDTAISTQCVAPAPAPAPAPAQPPANDPHGLMFKFGQTATWPDGLSITVGRPELVPAGTEKTEYYDPMQGKQGVAVKFAITVHNNTNAPFKVMMLIENATSKGREAPDVYFSDTHMSSAVALPGKSVTYYKSFAVLDPGDIDLEIGPMGEAKKYFTY